MPSAEPVYLEIGRKRTFAGGIDWPGWCRSGRDEQAALDALLAYGPRYKAALGSAGRGFRPPSNETALEIVERLQGDATTEFGAPSQTPSADEPALTAADAKRLTGILQACWSAFDHAASSAVGRELRKGPRGGGRELPAIVGHVFEADAAYLSKLGATWKPASRDAERGMPELRAEILGALRAWARGEPPGPARPRKLWNPRYAIRRSAWHALDHAWEIEDRAQTGDPGTT